MKGKDKTNLNLKNVYEALVDSVRYAKRNGVLKKALDSIDACFRVTIENYMESIILALSHEVVRKIQEFQELDSSLGLYINFMGPLEILQHYRKVNQEEPKKILSKEHESRFLPNLVKKWKKSYFLKNEEYLKSYYDKLNAYRSKLSDEATNLQIELDQKMKSEYDNLLKNELKDKWLLEDQRNDILEEAIEDMRKQNNYHYKIELVKKFKEKEQELAKEKAELAKEKNKMSYKCYYDQLEFKNEIESILFIKLTGIWSIAKRKGKFIFTGYDGTDYWVYGINRQSGKLEKLIKLGKYSFILVNLNNNRW